MKCPEGWRGEEKQEQAPCVEIQAGQREEREWSPGWNGKNAAGQCSLGNRKGDTCKEKALKREQKDTGSQFKTSHAH